MKVIRFRLRARQRARQPSAYSNISVKGQKTADGKVKTIWVGVNKDGTLYLVEEKNPKANERPKTGGGTTEQPNFGIKHKNQP